MRVDLDANDLERLLHWYFVTEVEMQNEPADDDLMKYLKRLLQLLKDEIREGEHED